MLSSQYVPQFSHKDGCGSAGDALGHLCLDSVDLETSLNSELSSLSPHQTLPETPHSQFPLCFQALEIP